MIKERKCRICGDLKPISQFNKQSKTSGYKKMCIFCEPKSVTDTQIPPKYGDKTKRIKEILRQREIVLENRLNSVNPLSKEFYDIYSELNNIRVKI